MKADYKNWMPKGMVMGTGCGSGALTIACAKKNPGASFTGIDRWGKEYASFSKKLCESNSKAEGFLGKMMVNGMNGGHAKMADWGMSHLKTIALEQIVKIGCGGGRNAGELLKKYPSSHVTAIDYSDVSVSKASAYNADAIKNGRCEVRQGDVSALILPEGRVRPGNSI